MLFFWGKQTKKIKFTLQQLTPADSAVLWLAGPISEYIFTPPIVSPPTHPHPSPQPSFPLFLPSFRFPFLLRLHCHPNLFVFNSNIYTYFCVIGLTVDVKTVKLDNWIEIFVTGDGRFYEFRGARFCGRSFWNRGTSEGIARRGFFFDLPHHSRRGFVAAES